MFAKDVLTEEWLADVLQDSLEMDWTTTDGARAIMRALERGLVELPQSGGQIAALATTPSSEAYTIAGVAFDPVSGLRIPAPSSEPAIAEGELAGIIACMDEMLADPKLDALAFDKHDSRIICAALAALPSKDATIAEAVERMRADPFIDDAHLLGTTSQDQRMQHYAAIALATTPPTTNDAIPAGWQLVPVEPTKEMLESYAIGSPWSDLRRPWSAMLAAAPSAPATEAGEGA